MGARRLSPQEGRYEPGGRGVGELATVNGVHRTVVSAHVARAGKSRGQLTEAEVDDAIRLYEHGFAASCGPHLNVSGRPAELFIPARG